MSDTTIDSIIDVRPSGAALGAEITGVDLSRPLSDTDFRTIEQAFNTHSVICLRDQHIGEEQFLAYCRRFGEVEINFLTHYGHPAYPEIMQVSNIQENGKNIGHADAGRVWHSDMSYMDTPPRATILHAREVPHDEERGIVGDTLFSSAVAAYDDLPQATKDRLEGLVAVHRVSERRKKTGTGAQDNKYRDAMPDVFHPVARTHPFTGRKSIYVSEGECVGILDMPDEEATPLLAELTKRAIEKRYRYRHKWRKDDVLMWDNCAVQHLATHDYEWPKHRRMMHRVTVGGSTTY